MQRVYLIFGFVKLRPDLKIYVTFRKIV